MRGRLSAKQNLKSEVITELLEKPEIIFAHQIIEILKKHKEVMIAAPISKSCLIFTLKELSIWERPISLGLGEVKLP